MTALVENLFLKFQKCLAVARKDLKPPAVSGSGGGGSGTVTVTISTTEPTEVAANAVVDASAAGGTSTTVMRTTTTGFSGALTRETKRSDTQRCKKKQSFNAPQRPTNAAGTRRNQYACTS